MLDGLALLQLVEAVERRPPSDITLVAFEHYPFSQECDASEATRQLCHRQEVAVLSRCHGIVAAGDVTRATLLSVFPELDPTVITVLRPPIRFAATGMGAERGAAAKLATAPSPASPLRLLIVANAIPRKNIGAVLRALAAVRQRGVEHWRLRIAGSLKADPAHAASLSNLATELGLSDGHVEWLGILDTPALAKLYRESHLFLLTSLFENYCSERHHLRRPSRLPIRAPSPTSLKVGGRWPPAERCTFDCLLLLSGARSSAHTHRVTAVSLSLSGGAGGGLLRRPNPRLRRRRVRALRRARRQAARARR